MSNDIAAATRRSAGKVRYAGTFSDSQVSRSDLERLLDRANTQSSQAAGRDSTLGWPQEVTMGIETGIETSDTTPPDEVGAPDAIGDAQISEIVDQELAIAVADPDAVYVVYLQYGGDSYTSVHTSQDGADARVRETASQWGIADILDADQLIHQVTKLPVETP